MDRIRISSNGSGRIFLFENLWIDPVSPVLKKESLFLRKMKEKVGISVLKILSFMKMNHFSSTFSQKNFDLFHGPILIFASLVELL